MKLALVISVEHTEFEAATVQGSWEQGIALAAGLGYDGVELAVRDPAAVDAGRVEASVGAAGLTVAAIATGQAYLRDGLSLSSPDAGIRARAIERVGNHLHFATRFHAPLILGLLRGRIEGGAAATRRRFADSLTQILPQAADAGTQVLIEPINRAETDFITTVDDALELIEGVPTEAVGILADTYHMHIEEHSATAALRRAGRRLAHVHVADSNRHAPGWGRLDFSEIIATLQEMGYARYLSAEVRPLPDAESAARQTISHLRAILGRRSSHESGVTNH